MARNGEPAGRARVQSGGSSAGQNPGHGLRSAPIDIRPGFAPGRLARLAKEAVEAMDLNLRGRVIYTEAATGPYAVTPVLAALAGAERVFALTRSTRHGSVEDAVAQTKAVAAAAGVWDPILITTERRSGDVRQADIVTNSGHVRPIDEEFVGWMKADAVVPLMFEAWEIHAGRFDLDLAALLAKGIAVAGTNERHRQVGVFMQLGPMAVTLLTQCGVAVSGARIVLLCDNPFKSYLINGLVRCGADVWAADTLDAAAGPNVEPDVVLVAQTPRGYPVLDDKAVRTLANRWPGAIVVQYWGDIDRTALAAAGLAFWPIDPPAPGHMAVLPSAVGPEPVVRLQAGGLKVAQVLLTPPDQRTDDELEYVDEL